LNLLKGTVYFQEYYYVAGGWWLEASGQLLVVKYNHYNLYNIYNPCAFAPLCRYT
jgi:hypothetical protein